MGVGPDTMQGFRSAHGSCVGSRDHRSQAAVPLILTESLRIDIRLGVDVLQRPCIASHEERIAVRPYQSTIHRRYRTCRTRQCAFQRFNSERLPVRFMKSGNLSCFRSPRHVGSTQNFEPTFRSPLDRSHARKGDHRTALSIVAPCQAYPCPAAQINVTKRALPHNNTTSIHTYKTRRITRYRMSTVREMARIRNSTLQITSFRETTD
ncbi:hypothetical protein OE88DRAFT_1223544 [Heliocybe sulcata]|uniref:Uncharacterized protein n=1 Tax=Heliocybe sulcata TaxID=5364 RepID=A0A5C3ML03_9AGAM|nr:hypothetical protein OE88DRAFT_1223544 [Heliocybe sulcata]